MNDNRNPCKQFFISFPKIDGFSSIELLSKMPSTSWVYVTEVVSDYFSSGSDDTSSDEDVIKAKVYMWLILNEPLTKRQLLKKMSDLLSSPKIRYNQIRVKIKKHWKDFLQYIKTEPTVFFESGNRPSKISSIEDGCDFAVFKKLLEEKIDSIFSNEALRNNLKDYISEHDLRRFKKMFLKSIETYDYIKNNFINNENEISEIPNIFNLIVNVVNSNSKKKIERIVDDLTIQVKKIKLVKNNTLKSEKEFKRSDLI